MRLGAGSSARLRWRCRELWKRCQPPPFLKKAQCKRCSPAPAACLSAFLSKLNTHDAALPRQPAIAQHTRRGPAFAAPPLAPTTWRFMQQCYRQTVGSPPVHQVVFMEHQWHRHARMPLAGKVGLQPLRLTGGGGGDRRGGLRDSLCAPNRGVGPGWACCGTVSACVKHCPRAPGREGGPGLMWHPTGPTALGAPAELSNRCWGPGPHACPRSRRCRAAPWLAPPCGPERGGQGAGSAVCALRCHSGAGRGRVHRQRSVRNPLTRWAAPSSCCRWGRRPRSRTAWRPCEMHAAWGRARSGCCRTCALVRGIQGREQGTQLSGVRCLEPLRAAPAPA